MSSVKIKKNLDMIVFYISVFFIAVGILSFAMFTPHIKVSAGQSFYFQPDQEKSIYTFLTGLETNPVGYKTVSTNRTVEQVPDVALEIAAASEFAGSFGVTESVLETEVTTINDYLIIFGQNTLKEDNELLAQLIDFDVDMADATNFVVKLYESDNGLQLVVIGASSSAVRDASTFLQNYKSHNSELNQMCVKKVNGEIKYCTLPTITVERDFPDVIYQGTQFVVLLDTQVNESNLPAGKILLADQVSNAQISVGQSSPTADLEYYNKTDSSSIVSWFNLTSIDQTSSYKITALDSPITFSGKWGLTSEGNEGVINGQTIVNVIMDSDGDGESDDTDCAVNDAAIFYNNTERCDGKDNDCDDQIDNMVMPLSDKQKGVCAGVRKVCNGINGLAEPDYYSLIPTYIISESDCDGLNNDCDDSADESYVTQITTCGSGSCQASGTTACVNGVVVNSCTVTGTSAEDKICNGIDDNCNGQKDEDYITTTINCGVGSCATEGTKTCVNGVEQETCISKTPSDEICGGGDENCNGVSNEGCAVSIGGAMGEIRSAPRENKNFSIIIGSKANPSDSLAAVSVAGKLGISKTVLDTEVPDITKGNYVLIGGPCANPKTTLIESKVSLNCQQSCSNECRQGYNYGFGKIQLIQTFSKGFMQIIVAGATADDTRAAGKAIANYENLNFNNNMIITSGTVNAPTVVG